MPILSFKSKRVAAFFQEGVTPREWRSIETVALRKLDMLDAATSLLDLRSPPGNRLERLLGDRKGEYSIRINDQDRLCFRWTDEGAEDVEIVDYH
jgi:proteic killer suppression protein